nr:ATP-dependent DNA helicase Q-like 5 [Ipomoea batatas]
MNMDRNLAGEIVQKLSNLCKNLAPYYVQVLFVSPDRLLSSDFISIFSSSSLISLVVVDEAHCVSEWLNSGKFSVDASQAGGSSLSSNVHNIKRWRQLCPGNVFAPTAGGLSTGSPPPGGIRTTFIDCAALSSDATSEGVAMQVPTTTAVSLTIESELRVVFVGGFVGGNCAFEGPSAPGLCATIADNCLTSFSRLARAMAWLWDVMDREETVVDNVSILSNCNSKALTDFCKALMADSDDDFLGHIVCCNSDLEARFLTSSYAILLRLATNNWLPTVAAHYVSKKMVIPLFKIQNNIQFDLGEMIFRHIMSFRQGLNSVAVHPSVSTRPPQRNLMIVQLDSAQSILSNLKSTVAQVERMILNDKQLLKSLEVEDQASAPTK